MVLSFNSVIFPEPAYVEQKEAPDDDIHGAHEITIRPEIQPEIEARTTYLMHFRKYNFCNFSYFLCRMKWAAYMSINTCFLLSI